MPFQLVVFSKETGEIVSIVRDKSDIIGVEKLGPGLAILRFFSSKPVDLWNWRVEQGQLVRKEPYVKLEHPVDLRYHVVMLGDKAEEPTGFGGQASLLGAALQERKFTVEYRKYTEVDERYNWQFNLLLSLCDLAQVGTLLSDVPSTWIQWLPISSKNISALFWERLLKVPFVVAMSQFGHDEIVAHGYPSNRLFMIAHGVDTKVFKPMLSLERQSVRISTGVDAKYVITSVGTNVERKRLELLLEAYAQVVAQLGQDKTILLLKTWAMGAIDVSAELKRLKLENSVRLYTEELSPEGMATLYGMSDLYVTATEAEGFGVPYIEAIACGVPVVGGDHTTASEIVGRFGTLVPCKPVMKKLYDYDIERYPPAPSDLAKAIIQHYNQAQQGKVPDKSQMRQYVVRNFSRELVVAMWEETLHKVLDLTGEAHKAKQQGPSYPATYGAVENLNQEVELLRL